MTATARAIVGAMLVVAMAAAGGAVSAAAAGATAMTPPVPPNNVDFPLGGDGFTRDLPAPVTLAAGDDWTLAGWMRLAAGATGADTLLGGVGAERVGAGGAYLIAGADTLGVWDGRAVHRVRVHLGSGWHAVAAMAHAGTITLTLDGKAVLRGPAVALVATRISIAPRGFGGFAPFGGRVAGFGFAPRATTPAELAGWRRARPTSG